MHLMGEHKNTTTTKDTARSEWHEEVREMIAFSIKRAFRARSIRDRERHTRISLMLLGLLDD